MFRGEYEPKGGGAACVAGVAGEGRCLYENASWQAYLWMAERDDRTILRGGQGEPWPALCAHAWDTEHAGTVFPDSSCAKYQEAGGLFLSRFSSLSNTLPLRLYLNAGVCQWSGPPQNAAALFARRGERFFCSPPVSEEALSLFRWIFSLFGNFFGYSMVFFGY